MEQGQGGTLELGGPKGILENIRAGAYELQLPIYDLTGRGGFHRRPPTLNDLSNETRMAAGTLLRAMAPLEREAPPEASDAELQRQLRYLRRALSVVSELAQSHKPEALARMGEEALGHAQNVIKLARAKLVVPNSPNTNGKHGKPTKQ